MNNKIFDFNFHKFYQYLLKYSNFVVKNCSKKLELKVVYPLLKGYTIKVEINPISPPNTAPQITNHPRCSFIIS